MKHLPRILTVLDYYLPGFKGGGPIRTLANMMEWLGTEYEFYIVTRDRDLGDKGPYPGIQRDRWMSQGKADRPMRIRYLAPEELRWRALERILNSLEYDLLYLNSFFSILSVKIMWLLYLGRIGSKPLVLAPRGEFFPSALAVRKYKKQLYLLAARTMNVYRRACLWHASTPDEAATIARMFPAYSKKVHTALDFMPKELPADLGRQPLPDGCLRLVSVARICPNKNLHFVLNILEQLDLEVHYDIYGPVEDEAYWERCHEIIRRLPPNIRVRYGGVLSHDEVFPTLARYHLFFLPTTGENFGHAIWEALSAGCLLLISDRTPWRNLEEFQVGWDISLDHPQNFKSIIEKVSGMEEGEFQRRSMCAQKYARNAAAENTTFEANRQLFYKALNSTTGPV